MMTQHLKTFAQNVLPNTFIGGVATTINTPTILANVLRIPVSNITAFKIQGNDIECKVSSIASVSNNGLGSSPITYYKGIGAAYKVINVDLRNNQTVNTLEFPDATSCISRLNYNGSVKQLIMPKLLTTTDANIFSNLTKCELIDIRSYIFNTSEINSDWYFYQLKSGCMVKVNIANKTSNNGGVAGTLINAKNSRQAIIEFYDNNGNYVSTL